MVPLGVTEYLTVKLFLIGVAVAFGYYYYTRRVFRVLFWSVVMMTAGSFSPLAPWPVDYILFIAGHIGLGKFVTAVVLALFKLLKIAMESSPFKLDI